jgi:hypothetical protein
MKEKSGVARVIVPERWNGCLLVNPLCPDDLCWLPAEGQQHRWHCLGTDRWDYRFTIGDTAFYLSRTSTTAAELIHEGWVTQLRMQGADHPHTQMTRQTNPDLFYEAFPEVQSGWGRGRPRSPIGDDAA